MAPVSLDRWVFSRRKASTSPSRLLWEHSSLFYYFEERRFGTFTADVAAVEYGAVTIGHFIAAQGRNSFKYRSCEIIAWLSGISGLVGLGALIVAVLKA